MSNKAQKQKSLENLLDEAIVPVIEQPYEVPGNWVWTRINSLAEVKGGKRLPKGESLVETQTEYPYLRVADFKNGTIDKSDLKYITQEVHEKITRYTISNNDVYVSIAGTIGKVGLIPTELNGSNLTENAAKITNLSCANKNFLYQVMSSEIIQSQIKLAIRATSQPKLALHRIQDLKIPVPPLKEQKRITDKVERLLNKIDEAKQLIDEAKETFELRRASILDKAFRGELTAKWREKNDNGSAFEWLDEISDNKDIKKKKNLIAHNIIEEPFKLPDKWKWVRINELGELARGKSKHRPRNDPKLFDGVYPFIQTGDVARAKDYLESYTQTLSEFGYNQSRLFPKGTVCITIAANIADTAILKFPCCFPDSVVGFNSYNNSVSSEYIHYYLTTIKSNIEQYAPATAQKNINLKILNEILVPLPPKEEHNLIVKKINQLLQYESLAKDYLHVEDNINSLKQSVLSKAFRGELGTNDPIEESSIELLKEVLKEKLKN